MPKRGLAPKIRAIKDKYPHLSNGAIARKVDCSPQNVSAVLAAYREGITDAELQAYQSNRGDIMDAIGARALLHITNDKLAKASPAELTTVMGILYDKSRLERGQATGINVNVLMDVAQAIRDRQRNVPNTNKMLAIDADEPAF